MRKGGTIMNNHLKWALQDMIKDYFKEMVKKGESREKIIITQCTEEAMKIPEIHGAIKFFVDSDCIEKLNESEYVITKGYYEWLQTEMANEPKEKEPLDFNISTKLKQRFCKDMGIPIKIFHEPYFESRLRLYDSQYNSIEKYKTFLELLSNFKSEQDYFEYYNKLKDNIIKYLGSREGMKRFKEENMNEFSIVNTGFPKKDIYKETFDGKIFLSIDMVKANFTALKHYDKDIVGGAETYEEFIGMFTEYDYFKSSKYLRQVVFGNHNPKRQATYERYLMDNVLTGILTIVPKEDIVFFSNDEIVIEMKEELDHNYIKDIKNLILNIEKGLGIKLTQELFRLRKIPGTKEGYIKKFIENGNGKGYEFKCLNSLTMPFVLRAYKNEKVKEEDKVFFHEGRLAKLIEVPEIEVV